MGRYNFRPQRIHETATALLEVGRLSRVPAWYNVVGDIRPPELLTRRQPVQHQNKSRKRQVRKASKAFQPQEIEYEEDALRKEFFKDHPWELARPRIVTEDNGVNGLENWSTIRPRGQLLSGESVVQRQLYLMDNQNLTKRQAYDVARSEFYNQRLREEVERRVAREEALHYGAFFGKNRLEIGMQLEDNAFEDWKTWADGEITASEQARIAGSAQGANASEPAAESASENDDVVEIEEAEDTEEEQKGNRRSS